LPSSNRPILIPPAPEQPAPERPAPAQERTKPKPRHRLLWAALAVLLLLCIGAVYLVSRGAGRSAAASAPAKGPPPLPVVAAKTGVGNIGVYFTGLGAVTPIYTVTVRSRIDGQLMSVRFKEGQTVRKGELLAEIDPRPYQVQLLQAQGQLAKDQAALANARVDLARYERLITRNAVAGQVLATQRATVAQDEGMVKTDEGQMANAKLNLIYTRITAPVAGRVGLRLVDPGNMVHAADTNGLLVITQVEPISVIFTISEDQVPPVIKKLRAGERLEVDAYDREMKNKTSQGWLMTIDNQIDQTTGTLKLRAVFDNKDGALFPNQFVNARLLVEEKRGVTLAPNAAIQRNSQNTFVYLVKPDQTVTVRQIIVGTIEGDQAEIVSGLGPGDVVVTTGVDKLQEGSKVTAQISGPNLRSEGR
jgi:membrane fusion protein, multidrug efflux system